MWVFRDKNLLFYQWKLEVLQFITIGNNERLTKGILIVE